MNYIEKLNALEFILKNDNSYYADELLKNFNFIKSDAFSKNVDPLIKKLNENHVKECFNYVKKSSISDLFTGSLLNFLGSSLCYYGVLSGNIGALGVGFGTIAWSLFYLINSLKNYSFIKEYNL